MDVNYRNKHTRIEEIIISLFIISLGVGEVINIGSIKLSIVMTMLELIVSLYYSAGRIRILGNNKEYNRLIKFLFVWIGYSLIQFILVRNIDLFVSIFRIQLINVIIMLILLLYINSMRDWHVVLRAFMILTIITALVGIWEIRTGRHIVEVSRDFQTIYYSHRPFGFYGNVNDYATVLTFGFFAFLLHLFAVSKKKIIAISDVFILVVLFLLIVATDCRGAYYSIVLLLVMMPVLYLLSKANKRIENVEKAYNIFLVVVVFSLIVIISSQYSMSDFIGKYSGSGNISSDMGRLHRIYEALASLLNSMGFGVGLGQSIAILGINLHFFYLEMLVESGIFIGGYFIYMFFRLYFADPQTIGLHDTALKALFKAFPVILILLGVASSSMARLRATWIIYILFYTLCYNGFEVFIEEEDLICAHLL